MTTVMSEQLSERIERWLREIGYTPAKMGPDEVAAWRFMINHPQGTEHKMQLIGPQGADDAVVIATAAVVSPEHIEGFARLDDGDRDTFLWELRRVLNKLEVEYRLTGDDGAPLAAGECPRRYEVMVTRYADGVTKDELNRMIGAVYKTWLAGVMLIQERLGGGDAGPNRRFDFKKLGL